MLSKAKRLLTADEFQRMQNILQNRRGNIIWRYGFYALINFQFHLLACIDDMTQVLVESDCVHDSFCNALKERMNFSKNVTEEGDAPWQIIWGSMDTVFPNAFLSPYIFGFCDDISIC